MKPSAKQDAGKSYVINPAPISYQGRPTFNPQAAKAVRTGVTIWDSFASAEFDKEELLKGFAAQNPGDSSGLARPIVESSKANPAVERIYHHVRAAMDLEMLLKDNLAVFPPSGYTVKYNVKTLKNRQLVNSAWGSSGTAAFFRLDADKGRARFTPLASDADESSLPFAFEHIPPSVALCINLTVGLVGFKVEAGMINLASTTELAAGFEEGSAELAEFWNFAHRWLLHYAPIPHALSHLYLAEAAYRFTHRGQDLNALLHDLLTRTSIGQIENLLEVEPSDAVV
jgi:hypothetical protein